jgi:hypothetical protein
MTDDMTPGEEEDTCDVRRRIHVRSSPDIKS